MATPSSSNHVMKSETTGGGGGSGGGGGGGETSEAGGASTIGMAAVVGGGSDHPQLMVKYRGLKKSKKDRGCTAKERISKMPPCAAGKHSSIYHGVTRYSLFVAQAFLVTGIEMTWDINIVARFKLESK